MFGIACIFFLSFFQIGCIFILRAYDTYMKDYYTYLLNSAAKAK